MDNQWKLPDKVEAPTPGEHANSPSVTTRRRFLSKGAKKMAYVTPVIVSLAASRAQAASGEYDSTCGDAGSPCAIDGDCCDNMCHWVMSTMVCCVDSGEDCTEDGDCCSYWCNGGTCF